MQFAVGSSRLSWARRSLYSFSAQGWNGTGPAGRLAARSPMRIAAGRHNPERSGLPSAARGAGADRLGVPSAIRGIPGVGWRIHCAAALLARPTSTIARPMPFIATLRADARAGRPHAAGTDYPPTRLAVQAVL